MRNKFYTHPSDDIIVDVDHMYNIRNGIINVGVEDVHAVVSGAENVIVLTGKGTGSNRVSNAIEDAVLHISSVAKGYNLYSADNIIVKFTYPQEDPLTLSVTEGILQFTEMFKETTSFLWGVSKAESESIDVIVEIIASNLKKN